MQPAGKRLSAAQAASKAWSAGCPHRLSHKETEKRGEKRREEKRRRRRRRRNAPKRWRFTAAEPGVAASTQLQQAALSFSALVFLLFPKFNALCHCCINESIYACFFVSVILRVKIETVMSTRTGEEKEEAPPPALESSATDATSHPRPEHHHHHLLQRE